MKTRHIKVHTINAVKETIANFTAGGYTYEYYDDDGVATHVLKKAFCKTLVFRFYGWMEEHGNVYTLRKYSRTPEKYRAA